MTLPKKISAALATVATVTTPAAAATHTPTAPSNTDRTSNFRNVTPARTFSLTTQTTKNASVSTHTPKQSTVNIKHRAARYATVEKQTSPGVWTKITTVQLSPSRVSTLGVFSSQIALNNNPEPSSLRITFTKKNGVRAGKPTYITLPSLPQATRNLPLPADTNLTPQDKQLAVLSALKDATPGWLSGVSGDGAADGRFAQWRGSPVHIGGTWNDSLEAQTAQWSLRPGLEWGDWSKPLDVAVGGIYQELGETWKDAAKGNYDSRWETMLTSIKAAREGKTGTVFVRFAHEFNGNWVPWTVSGNDPKNSPHQFKEAWKRFRGLQQRIIPEAKLVFCPNVGTSPDLRLDWRDAFPGSDMVDVMATDYYHTQDSPHSTPKTLKKEFTATDNHQAPAGVETHRRFAEQVGLPFALPEWGTDTQNERREIFTAYINTWFKKHGGIGAGKLLYEILFNVKEHANGKFHTEIPAG